MKKGIILVAKDPCVMDLSGRQTLTIGKTYKVVEVYKSLKKFSIIDDCGDNHLFDFDRLDEFFTIEKQTPSKSSFRL